MKRDLVIAVIVATLVMVLTGVSRAQEYTVQKADVKVDDLDYSPYVGRTTPTRVFWGDTHLHTSNSPDAGMIGNELGVAEAYRFARGGQRTMQNVSVSKCPIMCQ